jgi:hypothetical protein
MSKCSPNLIVDFNVAVVRVIIYMHANPNVNANARTRTNANANANAGTSFYLTITCVHVVIYWLINVLTLVVVTVVKTPIALATTRG